MIENSSLTSAQNVKSLKTPYDCVFFIIYQSPKPVLSVKISGAKRN